MNIYVPSTGVECWRKLLADPDKHWKTGRSAKALAYCWEEADGVPREIQALFGTRVEPLIAIPEYRVELPGGERPSQSDIFAIFRVGDATVACTVEGKVDETFGPTLDEWLKGASDGKTERLAYLCEQLDLTQPLPSGLRYQLLHRAASAVIEAGRFKTDEAAMIVHSFSQEHAWFDDFAAFVRLFGKEAARDGFVSVPLPAGKTLRLGWATGDKRYLAA